MVGGWADAYRDAILRFLAGFSGPSKGLIGPWAHTYPHVGQPGPAIGFLQEAVRWWDHCLKGVQNGIMDEPRLQVWMQDAVPPDAGYRDRPGRWIAERGWPAPSVSVRSYALGDGTLGEEAGEAKSLRHEGAQAPASDLGNWCPGGWSLGQADFPPDQRAEDQQALTFTSTPLDERLEIFGFPKLRIRIAADRPVALIAVRMCDVDADGASNLITRGLLNLTHRDGHEIPTLLEPGRPYDVEVGLSSIAYAIPAGHRLRVADLVDLLALGVAFVREGHADCAHGPSHCARAAGAPVERRPASAGAFRSARKLLTASHGACRLGRAGWTRDQTPAPGPNGRDHRPPGLAGRESRRFRDHVRRAGPDTFSYRGGTAALRADRLHEIVRILSR